MKHLYTTVLIFVFASSFSQQKTMLQAEINGGYEVKDSISGLSERIALTPKEFNKLLTNQMSSLLAGQQSNTIGTFAGLSIQDASVTFTPSIILKSGHIITAEVKGGITDGVAAIFNNNRLNTNIEFGLQYHFNNPFIKPEVSFRGDQLFAHRLELQKLDDSFKIDLTHLREYKLDELNTKLFELEQALLALEKQKRALSNIDGFILLKRQEILVNRDKINQKNIEVSQLSNSEEDTIKRNTLELELLKLKAANIQNENVIKAKIEDNNSREVLNLKIRAAKRAIELHQETISDFENQTFVQNQELLLRQARGLKEKALKKAFNPEISGIRLNWFSIGYNVRRDKFRLFEGTAEFADQFVKESTETHEVTVQNTTYIYDLLTPWRTYYNAIGLRFAYTNNLNDLTQVNVIDTQTIPNDEISRTITTTTTAYVGDFDEDLRALSIYDDFYYFILKKNKGAIHIAPEHIIRDDLKPKTNITFGFLFSFKNADKEDKTPVNAELFYSFIDVFDNYESEFDLFERNTIGLRFTFPINFSL